MSARQTIEAVAAEMLPEWLYCPYDEDHWFFRAELLYTVDAEQPERLQRRLHLRWTDKNRIELSVTSPADSLGCIAYPDDHPNMSVSGSRHPKAIAADIRRRFIPVAIVALDKMLEQVKNSDAAIARREQLAAYLTERYGMRPANNGSNNNARLYSPSNWKVYVTLDCHTDYGIRLDSVNVPADRVFAVLDALKGES